MILTLAGQARTDSYEGLAAYDGGDYYRAYLARLPRAEAGDLARLESWAVSPDCPR